MSSNDETVGIMLEQFRTGREIAAARDDETDTSDDQPVSNEQPTLRGTIEVGHVRSKFDLYGGRGRNDDNLRHTQNTEPTRRGWLGNPYTMDEKTPTERRRVIAAYLRAFLERIETDAEFRDAVEGLRGQRVACWCRGVSAERTPDNWCHLDVVHHWLDGDLRPVYNYLRAGQ